jgi:uncharacterized membrane protein YfcA
VEFSTLQLTLVLLIFCWTGFVRTGLGFGGAALGLPFMLLVAGSPVDWLPIIGLHLLFFSGLSLSRALKQVDWAFFKKSLVWILPAKIVGVIGLLRLPGDVMSVIVYSITAFYALTWLFNYSITSNKRWLDNLLLTLGGYISGTSLTGAPLIVAVYMHNVVKEQLRNTLFVLWFFLVTIKMGAFVVVGQHIDWQYALMFLPAAWVGHYFGLKAHDKILENDQGFKRWMGGVLIIICAIGIIRLFAG